MRENIQSLNQLHYDVLCEIGNIGVGNATGVLSKLIGKPVRMTVPKVKLVEFRNVGEILGSPEDLIFGILVNFSGAIEGMVMFILQLDSARNLINSMLGKDFQHTDEFSELDLSALQEIGNILCSSYLGALSTLINKKVLPSPPMLAKDMAAAVLSVPAIEFSKIADNVLLIDTVFIADSQNVSGYFLLVPDMNSFHTILSSLGVQ